MNNSIKDEWALVFSGGGVKGSYEIGVWQSLIESGADKLITAVSGTSVGALNAALFVLGDYKRACEIWLSITQEDIVGIDFKKLIAFDAAEKTDEADRADKISKRKLFYKLIDNIKELEINKLRAEPDEGLTPEQRRKRDLVLDFFNEIAELEINRLKPSFELDSLSGGKKDYLLKLLRELDPLGINRLSEVIKKGTVKKIIDENIDNNILKSRGIKLYAACSALNDADFDADGAVVHTAIKYIVKNIKDYSDTALANYCINMLRENSRPVYFDINEARFNASDILMASAAFPIALEKTTINGTAYIDGGVFDNTPVKPLYELGYRKFIVVYLDTSERISREAFPDSKIIEIGPDDSRYDKLKRIVTVNKAVIKEQIATGFNDGIRAIRQNGLNQ